ncbi:unnamed protein product [Anisakis simplex]|uniref:Postacrosomal sheath WW domain-binding protein n=1 Tax=Anisakis simplex TaxID=6269 RepID=A0A0M3JV42_ANISI|nr:unnamed protein product [Anisakis simplex]
MLESENKFVSAGGGIGPALPPGRTSYDPQVGGGPGPALPPGRESPYSGGSGAAPYGMGGGPGLALPPGSQSPYSGGVGPQIPGERPFGG